MLQAADQATVIAGSTHGWTSIVWPRLASSYCARLETTEQSAQHSQPCTAGCSRPVFGPVQRRNGYPTRHYCQNSHSARCSTALFFFVPDRSRMHSEKKSQPNSNDYARPTLSNQFSFQNGPQRSFPCSRMTAPSGFTSKQLIKS